MRAQTIQDEVELGHTPFRTRRCNYRTCHSGQEFRTHAIQDEEFVSTHHLRLQGVLIWKSFLVIVRCCMARNSGRERGCAPLVNGGNNCYVTPFSWHLHNPCSHGISTIPVLMASPQSLFSWHLHNPCSHGISTIPVLLAGLLPPGLWTRLS